MLLSEQHENTDMLPIIAQVMDSINQFNKIVSKMNCRGLAHEQHLPGESNKFSYYIYTCMYERGWSFIAMNWFFFSSYL